MVKLTPTKRARVVRMRDNEGLKFPDIAHEFGVTIEAARPNYKEVKRTGNPYRQP